MICAMCGLPLYPDSLTRLRFPYATVHFHDRCMPAWLSNAAHSFGDGEPR